MLIFFYFGSTDFVTVGTVVHGFAEGLARRFKKHKKQQQQKNIYSPMICRLNQVAALNGP